MHNRRFMSQARRTRILRECFSSPRLALRAKCRVHFAWLKNHLLCRLKLFGLTHSPWNTRKNTACGGQGQLWHLTCAEGRDLSNYVRMSTIQLRRPDKRQKPKKPENSDKILFHYPPTILKAFPKCFSHRNEA